MHAMQAWSYPRVSYSLNITPSVLRGSFQHITHCRGYSALVGVDAKMFSACYMVGAPYHMCYGGARQRACISHAKWTPSYGVIRSSSASDAKRCAAAIGQRPVCVRRRPFWLGASGKRVANLIGDQSHRWR